MTEFSEIARNKNRFRAACKDFSVEQLETMAAQLSEFIEKRTQEEVDMAEKNAKKDAEKQAIFAAIAEAGLTPADFFSDEAPKANKAKNPRKPVAAQYRITDPQGVQHEWSGRGRTPKAFDHYFNNGGSKDSCRI